MLLSILALLCGIVLVFNPFEGATFITKIVGVLLFLYAIIDIVASLRIRKTVKRIEKALEVNTIKDADVIEDNTHKNKKKKEESDE